MSALAQALAVFDSLDARELAFILSCTLVDPEGVTREHFREHLRSGRIAAEQLLGNVFVMREMAPRAWGLRVVR